MRDRLPKRDLSRLGSLRTLPAAAYSFRPAAFRRVARVLLAFVRSSRSLRPRVCACAFLFLPVAFLPLPRFFPCRPPPSRGQACRSLAALAFLSSSLLSFLPAYVQPLRRHTPPPGAPAAIPPGSSGGQIRRTIRPPCGRRPGLHQPRCRSSRAGKSARDLDIGQAIYDVVCST